MTDAAAPAATPLIVSIPPDIGKLAGPTLLGHMFNWGLYGMLCIQVYIYYLSFPRDPLRPQLIVYFSLIVETLQVILNAHDLFVVFGLEYGNLEVLNDVHFAWLAIPILSGIVSVTVQTFYAYRIIVLSNGKLAKVIAASIVAVAIMQFAGAIATGVKTKRVGLFSELQDNTFTPCSIWLAGSAFCDVLIAVSMTAYLWNSKTGFNATKVLLTKLIRLTIETGASTATFAIIELSLFLAYPNNNYHMTPALCLSKMYSNTLMAVLNSRSNIAGGREELYGGGLDDVVMNTCGFLAQDAVAPGCDAPTLKGAVRIRTEMWRDDI